MPKKFSAGDKRDWLDLYEKGKTELQIAREHVHCDVRTVKKAIEEARRQRDAQTARAELLKEALRKHHGDLLSIIEGILPALQVPPANLEVSWKLEASPSPIRLSGATAQYKLLSGCTVFFQSENSPLWGLLEEHLKRDQMWKVIGHWKRVVAAHIDARIALNRMAAMLLEKKTGLKLVDRVPEQGPYLLAHVAMPQVYEPALHVALGIRYGREPEHDIVADTKNGEVTYQNSPLAKVPGAEQECRQNILKAIAELRASTEAENVATTYREVVEITAKARRVVEEIALLGLVPGQCRVCRRLGV